MGQSYGGNAAKILHKQWFLREQKNKIKEGGWSGHSINAKQKKKARKQSKYSRRINRKNK